MPFSAHLKRLIDPICPFLFIYVFKLKKNSCGIQNNVYFAKNFCDETFLFKKNLDFNYFDVLQTMANIEKYLFNSIIKKIPRMGDTESLGRCG